MEESLDIEQVKDRILAVFPGAEVEVEDPRGSGNYYAVSVKSPLFAGKTRIAQHRMVQDVFKEELKSGEIHALTIKTQQ